MENAEVPEYFICPISLQIMKDPVTAITGITYDRESIEHWVFKNHNTICPVTNQPLPRDSDLTPNHTLRRLIQSWCVVNGANGIDRIPTPKPPLSKFYVLNLVLDLSVQSKKIRTLEKLELLAMENERNKQYMVETGVPKALVSFLIQCYKKGNTNGLDIALTTLSLISDSFSSFETKVEHHEEIIDSIMWTLGLDREIQNHAVVKAHAMCVLKTLVGKANSGTLEKLKPEFFKKVMGCLGESNIITQKGLNAALDIMLDTTPLGRNRTMMIESRAVFELIELELMNSSNKRTTELILGILFNLCSCADGRAQLLSHAAGIALITKRILKVSPVADERAILILSLICKYSATSGVLQEMLKVGTVAKLCTVLQAHYPSYLKEKATEILRAHSDVWKNSPCVEIATLTRHGQDLP